MDELQNIYFNIKDSEHFGKCNFPFLHLRQSRVLFFHLLLFTETLLCKPGVWSPLRAPEAVTLLTVKYAFSHFSWYLFFKLFNIHCVWMNYKISISILKILNILGNAIFLFFTWDNQGSCFFIYFCLLKHYSVSWGSWAHLGPQKLSHF